jgi:hypothetical protein
MTAMLPIPDVDPSDPPVYRMRTAGYAAGRTDGVEAEMTQEVAQSIIEEQEDGSYEAPSPFECGWTVARAFEAAGIDAEREFCATPFERVLDETFALGAAFALAYRNGYAYSVGSCAVGVAWPGAVQ